MERDMDKNKKKQGAPSTKRATVSTKAASSGIMKSINPATLEEFDQTESSDLALMPDRFRLARDAQKEWSKLSFNQRAKYLKRIRNYIRDHAEDIASIVAKDNGKTKMDALITEVIPIAMATEWYAKNTGKILRPQKIKSSSILFFNKKNVLIRQPLGIVAIISPWNYPLSIPFGEIMMGLMSGNAVFLKAAPDVIATGKIIEKIIAAAELPPGLFNHIIGPAPQILDAFLENGVNKIFFTGSVATGKIINQKASEYLVPVSLELGGKDAMIVLPDANLERASNGAAWAGYQNCGQTCAGVERIYVHESVYDKFLALMIAKTNKLRQGFDKDFNLDLGSMTNENQQKKVAAQVQDALKKGARIVAQSHLDKGSGYFYPATLMVDVNHDMEIMKEETFGPVLPLMKYRDVDEAIALANDSTMGLTASIWTKDVDLGKKIAYRIEAGVITINDHLYTHGQAETPWGGWKSSGSGRTHGAMGIEEMTQSKVINWDILPSMRNLWWYPFDKGSYKATLSIFGFLYPKSIANFLTSSKTMSTFLVKKMFSKWNV